MTKKHLNQDILNAAYSVIAGLPGGPYGEKAFAAVADKCPGYTMQDYQEAYFQAQELKLFAVNTFFEYERKYQARYKRREKILAAVLSHKDETMEKLRQLFPGFGEEVYERAWSDGELINKW